MEWFTLRRLQPEDLMHALYLRTAGQAHHFYKYYYS